ncbi:MAG: hypothetical protein R3C25_02270 [Hyphomonadaceae bacterium]
MSEADLVRQLKRAEERVERASRALAPKHKGGEWEEFEAAHDDLLRLERALASHRGESFAEPLDFPVRWDIGAPLPHLVQSDNATYLAFYLGPQAGASQDGSVGYGEPQVVDSRADDALAIVRFDGCVSTQMGDPNDEVFQGHPLYGRGLQGYRPMVVRNSAWINQLQAINSVHSMYDPSRWTDLNHYFFGFHDSTFECVARSFEVEIMNTSMSDALRKMCERLVE